MYRIYDKEGHCWVSSKIYLTPNDDLLLSKKAFFGKENLHVVSNDRYVVHTDIGLYDKNYNLIFEGDIVWIEFLQIYGVISYVSERAAYYIFDYKNYHYYILSIETCKNIEIVGNVYDNFNLIEE